METDLHGKSVLVSGARGMLASDLLPLLKQAGARLSLCDLVAGDSQVSGLEIIACDICDSTSVRQLTQDLKPDWILNCAAYTRVDDAEQEREASFNVNAVGPGNLAKAARDIGASMVHFSSDYVFGGRGAEAREGRAYTEDDLPHPCGIYGQSKRFGDELVKEVLPESHLILRPSWLHGVGGPNFIDAILRLGKERDELKVVDDQIGSPTWAPWLGEVVVALMSRDARGTFNATSRGNISWYDFAEEIIRLAALEVSLATQTTEELNRPAPRPPFSTLDLRKLEDFLGVECISWKEGVRKHMEVLGEVKVG